MDSDGNSRLAGEIRAEIARQRLSGRRVAIMIGKPPSTVGRWVSGETPMTLEEVEAFARALKVSVVDLVARAYDKAAASTTPPRPPNDSDTPAQRDGASPDGGSKSRYTTTPLSPVSHLNRAA